MIRKTSANLALLTTVACFVWDWAKSRPVVVRRSDSDVSSVPHLRTVRRVHAEAIAAELQFWHTETGSGFSLQQMATRLLRLGLRVSVS